ncbi:hypothetical protein B0J12DRAFT_701882 [Macrophomina phaseolina]|uniref:Uncharacterized protein n=1 Tax=Macrophomina phaseolina TaxID=35725 RepID=A0ABQ8G3J0_9PEZI|nr:hypothetical protein B0J12DRAFT_701882 [Macrophomina phaseolina]
MLIFRLDALLLYAAALLCALSIIAAPSVARPHAADADTARFTILKSSRRGTKYWMSVHSGKTETFTNKTKRRNTYRNIEPRQASAIVAGVVIAVSWLADLIELGTTVSFTLGEITGTSVAVEAAAGSAGTVAGVTFGVVEAITEVTYGIASRSVISAVLKRAVQSNNGANIAAYVSTAAQALAVR